MITQLNLSKNCKALHGRVEDHKKKYDVVTARAVAYADKLLPWIDSILKSWWHAILYKLFTNEEDALIHKYWRKFIEKHIYTLDNDSVQRCIYILKK